MSVYIILFRGVGGATQLPVAKLREALTAAGFENVATYINSGNAVVKSALGHEKVVETIAGICRRTFKFDKAIYAITLAEWTKLIASNPFKNATEPGNLLHAAWLAEKPKAADVKALEDLADNGDRFAVVGKIAYLHTPNGFSKSKLSEKFDKKIGVPNTARNWNTVLKLEELAEKAK
ncbi:hypothetical protein GJW-30_1_01255 [Variibacter gotjawalensis]|uniref:DUF1697 domain-containing protein n=1 Tax=Variibacter gotjawalensis TaxID=1333996 RepID=A0A0S3PRZ1_9BRAD|nr:DUF1697 domain-containing protein [Variibacter gotjawalensis]NIK49038.1 uncharacterized protein (DUF1697 family) [Variibacter gotjawalensis]RZS50894.1 uncharacterized protein (DUF1697 family) [Variibacter gotjawalensis]BAT58728.1 hypothetical protein GJW-30_1_01255 [Variibacter gotjawalensis]